MRVSRPQSVATALSQGRDIDAADLIALLSEVYPQGVARRTEAEALIEFDRTLSERAPAWSEFFAATVADHLLHRSPPAGAVTDEKAEWLITALGGPGGKVGPGGFAALMRVIETAPELPAGLSAFALEQVLAAVIAGHGPARGTRVHAIRTIDSEDAVLVARILEAAGGAAGRPVSRAEAEILFDLHDACAGNDNDVGFEDLFFKAVASHLIAAAGHRLAPRRDMLAPDPRLAERRTVFGRRSDPREAGFRLPSNCADSTLLGAEELAWLAARVMRDGNPTAAEHALLRLFAQPAVVPAPPLQPDLVSAA
jgi:hypothetical protein